MKLIVTGNVKPKKNSKQIMINRRTNKPFIMTNKAASDYITDAVKQLKQQFEGLRITHYPISVQMTFYYPTKHRKDIDNSASTILDCMKTAGVIIDDDCQHVDELYCSFGGYDKENPRVEIILVD
jgi:Holliday junction resolvase RusA-like endonuclease